MILRTLIEDYLAAARLMQVATVKGKQPWACSVYFAYDEHLNLYWLSLPSTRHSVELRANQKVAGTIVLPLSLGDDVRGLQFQGTATELSGKAAETQMKYYAERMKLSEERVKDILNGTDGHRLYQIKPSIFVLFDELNFPDHPRQEYKV